MDIEDRVLLAKNGDKEMFTSLIKERKEDLYRIAYMYVKNQQDALDIVSETIYKSYFSINKLKELKYFTTWLTRILINCALDHLKKYNNTVSINQHEEIANRAFETSKEEIIDLYDAVDKLKVVYKTVIILKYDVTSISGHSKEDNGMQRKSVNGTWNISFNIDKEKLKQANPKTLLVKNKKVVVDDMLFTIDTVKSYPTNTDVHITFDLNNPYRFVDFKNIYMEDETGTKYNFKGSSQENQYEYTLHFTSNYFISSKHLQLKCDGIYIMPTEKQYIEVDLKNKKIIDDSGLHLDYLSKIK